MHPIPPATGAPEVRVAEDQPEYQPITVAIYSHENGTGVLLARYTFTDEERQEIANGADVYFGQLNFGHPMTPILARVGPGEWLVPNAV